MNFFQNENLDPPGTTARIDLILSLKQLIGHKLSASDGLIGQLKDLCFDDQTWALRYVVADIGAWLPGRQVLLSPHAFGAFDPIEKRLRVRLTRHQIEGSPPLRPRGKLSRQDEAEHHRYYGWTHFWMPARIPQDGDVPVLLSNATPTPANQALVTANFGEGADEHLQSTAALIGYGVQATDGMIGEVCDFLIDRQNWAIRNLVVRTGRGRIAREVTIPTASIDRISTDESIVAVNFTTRALGASPEGKPVAVGIVL